VHKVVGSGVLVALLLAATMYAMRGMSAVAQGSAAARQLAAAGHTRLTLATAGSDAAGSTATVPAIAVPLSFPKSAAQGLEYRVQSGTFNMYYTHVGSFLVAATLNISRVHVPRNITVPHQMGESFQFEPIDTLLDIASTQQYFGAKFSMDVTRSEYKGCRLPLELPPCTSQEDLAPLWADFLTRVPQHCKSQFTAYLSPTLFGKLNYSSFGNLRAVVKGLPFSKAVRDTASAIKAGLVQAAGPSYVGIHLRVESDSTTWFHLRGVGNEYCKAINWVLYHHAAHAAGLSNTSALYIACGMSLEALKKEKFGDAFLSRRYSGTAYTKSSFFDLSNSTMYADVLAAVDFLVLADAEVAMGHPRSTMSWFLAGYRVLMLDKSPHSFHMVDPQGMLYDVTSANQRGKHDRQAAQCVSLLPPTTKQ
jgi:hypothetical protein